MKQIILATPEVSRKDALDYYSRGKENLLEHIIKFLVFKNDSHTDKSPRLSWAKTMAHCMNRIFSKTPKHGAIDKDTFFDIFYNRYDSNGNVIPIDFDKELKNYLNNPKYKSMQRTGILVQELEEKVTSTIRKFCNEMPERIASNNIFDFNNLYDYMHKVENEQFTINQDNAHMMKFIKDRDEDRYNKINSFRNEAEKDLKKWFKNEKKSKSVDKQKLRDEYTSKKLEIKKQYDEMIDKAYEELRNKK